MRCKYYPPLTAKVLAKYRQLQAAEPETIRKYRQSLRSWLSQPQGAQWANNPLYLRVQLLHEIIKEELRRVPAGYDALN